MKKVICGIMLFIATCFLTSCEEGSECKPKYSTEVLRQYEIKSNVYTIIMSVVFIDNHEYLFTYFKGNSSSANMIHSESCPCKNQEE